MLACVCVCETENFRILLFRRDGAAVCLDLCQVGLSHCGCGSAENSTLTLNVESKCHRSSDHLHVIVTPPSLFELVFSIKQAFNDQSASF